MAKIIPNKDIVTYLKGDNSSTRKQYLAMIRFYIDGWDAQRVAEAFGYTASTYTPLLGTSEPKLTGPTAIGSFGKSCRDEINLTAKGR